MRTPITLALVLFLLSFHTANAQTCTGTFEFYSQADIDQFLINNPTCTSIDGSVTIYLDGNGSTDYISNMDGFQNIQSISGSLQIANYGGTNQSISFAGFSALNQTGGLEILDLTSIPAITDLTGFENLQSTDYLSLNGCEGLSSLSVFDNLSSVAGISIRASNNIDYTNVFPSVTSLSDGFLMYEVDLDHFNGFNSLVSAGQITIGAGSNDFISIDNFDAFNNLTSVYSIAFSFVIMDTMHAFESVQTAQGVYLDISFLTSFEAFSSLTNTPQLTIYSSGGGPITYTFEELLSAYIEVNFSSQQANFSFPVLQTCSSLLLTSVNSFNSPNLNLITNDLYMYVCSLANLSFLSNVSAIQGNVNITGNYLLSDCSAQAICDKINTSPELVTIGENLIGCNTIAEVADNCAFSYATGIVYVDQDCDGLYNNLDVIIPNAILHDENSMPVGSTYSNGSFILALNDNSTTSITAAALVGFTSLDSYTITTANNDSAYTNLDFGLCPDANSHNVSIDLIAFNNPRPGNNYYCMLNISNQGGYTEDVMATLDFSGMPGLNVVNAGGGILSGNTITWNVTNLEVFSSNHIYVTFHLNNSVLPGTPYVGAAFIEIVPSTIIDLYPGDNAAIVNDIVVASYDPNYKSVDRTQIDFTEIADGGPLELEYEIHFQNTGTAEALTVRLEDDIAPYFNLGSFQMLSSSHAYELSFDGSHVEWLFNDINLPDSASDELGSQGFVKFRISTFGNHALNNIIENTSAIYFDYNPAVITNTATTIFYQCPLSLEISGPTAACAGENISFNASSDWTNYNWSIAEQPAGNASNLTMNEVQSGAYQIELNATTEYCNYIVTVELIVNEMPPTPTISQSGNTLTASGTGVFSWTLNGSPIGNGTSELSITESGIYAVIVENNGCVSSETSGDFQYVGVAELSSYPAVLVSPNPMNTETRITLSGNIQGQVLMIVCDQTGRKALEKRVNSNVVRITNSELQSGVYFLSFIQEDVMIAPPQKLIVE